MRPKRELAENVWYYVNTAVNNGEPLFLSEFGVWLLEWVLSEARLIFAFELRGVRFAGASVSFFIKPAGGLQLPEIMKWVKQTFAARFNVMMKRAGHIWGAQGCTRTGERVVVSRQHGGPLTQALPRTRPTGPTAIGRAYWQVSRRRMRTYATGRL
jgi:hypothetical protein